MIKKLRFSLKPLIALSILLINPLANAQPPGMPGFQPPGSAKDSAQLDITGYWVALVTEDWLWRMITAPQGDATSIPLNPAGQQLARTWDIENDIANGEQCRPFGAAGLMRQPLRLRITWADDETLKIETDAGEQTRLLHFEMDNMDTSAEASWQGLSKADWTHPTGFDLRAIFGDTSGYTTDGPTKGSIKVETSNLRSGYLRKNGIPYSDITELTEYFTKVSYQDTAYMTVLSIVHDPIYLNSDFVTSSHFKREPDGANWNPSPCQTAVPILSSGE